MAASVLIGATEITVSYTSEAVLPRAQAQEIALEAPSNPTPLVPLPLPPEALISQISEEYGISSTTLYNLAWSESGLSPDPKGYNDDGEAAGIVQIHYEKWGVSREQALDPEFALSFAAEHIKNDTAWKYWTPCSCVKTARVFSLFEFPQVYSAAHIPANSYAQVGGLVLLTYDGVGHAATIQSIDANGLHVIEGNFKPCLISKRTILWTDPHIRGYWNSSQVP